MEPNKIWNIQPGRIKGSGIKPVLSYLTFDKSDLIAHFLDLKQTNKKSSKELCPLKNHLKDEEIFTLEKKVNNASKQAQKTWITQIALITKQNQQLLKNMTNKSE